MVSASPGVQAGVSDCLSDGIHSSRPKDLRADSPKVKPLAQSSAEVRPLWEEPRDSRKTSGDLGILAIHGGEDVKGSTSVLQVSGSACLFLRFIELINTRRAERLRQQRWAIPKQALEFGN